MQRVVVATSADYQQAGERGDRVAHLVAYDEPAASDEFLFGEEGTDQAIVARREFCRQATPQGNVALDAGDRIWRERPRHGSTAPSLSQDRARDQPGEDRGRAERNRRGRAHRLSPVS